MDFRNLQPIRFEGGQGVRADGIAFDTRQLVTGLTFGEGRYVKTLKHDEIWCPGENVGAKFKGATHGTLIFCGRPVGRNSGTQYHFGLDCSTTGVRLVSAN